MITLLHIKNIALIDECEINLNEGLNILSGETGAGKSIIIDALGFLLGAKADKNLIRHGEKEAFVEGIFKNINSNAERILSELGISLDEGKVIIERKLLSDGRCDARINNKIVTLTALKSLTSVLCDICGQHEHQFLLKVSNHLGILDRFGGTNIGILKDKISEELKTYRHYKNLIKNLGSAEELERLEDLINYQIKDIENANLNDIDEDNQIKSKLQILNNSEKISSSIKNFINYADSNENGFIEIVSLSLKELSSLEKYDTEYGLFKERIDNVLIELKDIVNEVKSKAEELTYDENQLIKLQKRMDEISNDVQEMIDDYSNRILTSSVCVQELIHLCQIGKVDSNKKEPFADARNVIPWLMDMGIEVVTVSTRHLSQFSLLPFMDGHRDPNDRLIISQAISDKIPLVSSDRKFEWYRKYGLDFMFNER